MLSILLFKGYEASNVTGPAGLAVDGSNNNNNNNEIKKNNNINEIKGNNNKINGDGSDSINSGYRNNSNNNKIALNADHNAGVAAVAGAGTQETSEVSIDDLPFLVMAKVFECFTMEEAMRMGSVSVAWRHFASLALRTATEFTLDRFTSERMKRLQSMYGKDFGKLPSYRKQFKWWEDMENIKLRNIDLTKVLRLMCGEETGKTKLQTIDLTGVDITYGDDSRSDNGEQCREEKSWEKGFWSSLGVLCPELESLNLGSGSDGGLGLGDLDHMPAGCKKLRSFTSGREELRYDQILLIVSECTELKYLNIAYGTNYLTNDL